MRAINSTSGQSRMVALLALAAVFMLAEGAAIAQQGLDTPSNGAGIGTALRSGQGAQVGNDRIKLESSVSSRLAPIPEDFAKLKLAAGFLVNVQIFDGADFSGPYRLDGEGNISLPFVGAINLEGKTVAEAQDIVAAKLKTAQLFNQPQVQITVQEYSAPTVTIMGEVTSPGKYPLLAEHKLVEVLSLAGGLTPAAGDNLEIERNDGAEHHVLKLNYGRGMSPASVSNVTVKPGDVIQVPRAGMVYVLGAVNRPGAYLMQEDGKLDITQAIALAYGTSIQASTGKIRIIRRKPDGSLLEIPVHYKRTIKAESASVVLQPQDVVYVPPSGIKSALVSSQQVLSSAASATIYYGFVH